MQFEYDPETLIEEVRKRPGLWDFDHPEYRMKHQRIHLWGDVVKELMQADVTMSKGEIRELELQLQKKWKSIRDCFQKYLTNPNKTRRPYVYTKKLQFLLKDQKLPKRSTLARKEEASSESGDEEQAKQNRLTWTTKKRLKISKRDEPSEDDDDDGYNVHIDYDSSKNETFEMKANNSTNVENNQFAFASVDTFKDTDDPDKMFLLSLLPHLKSLPEEFRLNAKMELMQVLQQANYSVAKLI